MKITRSHLRKLILEHFESILIEQDEEEAEEPTGDEEEATEDEEEATEDEEGDEPVDPEELPGPNPEPEDAEPLGKTIDDELEAIMIDFEADAIKSAKLQQSQDIESDEVNEFSMPRLGKILFEQDDEVEGAASDATLATTQDEMNVDAPPIDLEKFASEIARLVKNYDALLDMKRIIVNKATAFIEDKYSQAKAIELEDLLATRHDIATADEEVEDEPRPAPIAVGAISGDDSGGGI